MYRTTKKILIASALLILLVPFTAYSQDLPSDLCQAAKQGDTATVKTLLAKGANVNAKNESGETALMCAAGSWDIGSIRFGAGGIGGSLVYKENVEIIKMLLSKGADVNARDKFGYTALMDAAARGHIENVRLLLAKGADINAKNEGGETALVWAIFQRHTETVEMLLSKGADVNARTKGGTTALMFAIPRGSIETVEMLLSKGADVDVKNDEGFTALMIAEKHGHSEIVRLLKQAGAKE